MGSKLTWKYNNLGHVGVWKGDVGYPSISGKESDLYIQNDDAIESFFKNIGINMKRLRYNNWGVANDVGYFND